MLIKYIFPLLLSMLPTVLSAQTCASQILETAPDSRFTNQGDGTVLDTGTGLVWKRCSEGQVWNSGSSSCTGSVGTYTWLGAFTQVDSVNTSGFASQTDWRLPNRKELGSIIEQKCYSPAVNETYFLGTTLTSSYWTSSPSPSLSPTQAWSINLGAGTGAENTKEGTLAIRLVRAGY